MSFLKKLLSRDRVSLPSQIVLLTCDGQHAAGWFARDDSPVRDVPDGLVPYLTRLPNSNPKAPYRLSVDRGKPVPLPVGNLSEVISQYLLTVP